MTIDSSIIDTREAAAPSVLSIALDYMGMALDFPCLSLEAQLVQKSVN